MARVKLTKYFIDGIAYSEKADVYQNDMTNGFAVRTAVDNKLE